MAWEQDGNIRGPEGPPGPPATEITAQAILDAGGLLVQEITQAEHDALDPPTPGVVYLVVG